MSEAVNTDVQNLEVDADGEQGRKTLVTEVWGLVLLMAALCLFLALISFSRVDTRSTGEVINLIGPVGVTVADVTLEGLGLCAFFLNAVLFFAGFALLFGRNLRLTALEGMGFALALPSSTMVLHLLFDGERVLGHKAGGIIGELGAEIGRSLIGSVGTTILTATALLLAATMIFAMSPSALVVRMVTGTADLIRRLLQRVSSGVRSSSASISARVSDRLQARVERKQKIQEGQDVEGAARTLQPLPGHFPPPIEPIPLIGMGPVILGDEALRDAMPESALGPPPKTPPKKDDDEAPDTEASPKQTQTNETQAEEGLDAEPEEDPDAPPPLPAGVLLDSVAPILVGPRVDRTPKKAKLSWLQRRKDKAEAKKALPRTVPSLIEGVEPFEIGPPEGVSDEDFSSSDFDVVEEHAAGPDAPDAHALGPDAAGPDAPDAIPDAVDEQLQADCSTESAPHDAEPCGADLDQIPPLGPPPKISKPLAPPIVEAFEPEPEDDHTTSDGAADSASSERKTIAIGELRKRPAAQVALDLTAEKRGDFELPGSSLLTAPPASNQQIDRAGLEADAAAIEQALLDFKIEGQITGIQPGPVVTMFEFDPAPGVKLSKITNLSADIARVMRAQSVRIVAPIPGKGVVGLEVPSKHRETVYLREILEESAFKKTRAKLPLVIGKGIAGEPVISDLAKMPHLLVAGSTGSGKSVAINTMILSLLYTRTPEEVRLIMVDPKMLELSIYDDIPHLLVPVVTDPNKAATALKWAVDEMERRYRLLSQMKVRNIGGFNREIERLQSTTEGNIPQCLFDEDGEPDLKNLPYIVVIIDEFADLMMVAAKEVEICVARLAQKARAAGIHLILATQRPSVDVITGLIKANLPTRISFRVFSRIDSRTVLDTQGAENLLGMGDMLFRPPGRGDLQRAHGAFVDEKEVLRVVEHLKEQGQPEYQGDILISAEETMELDDIDDYMDEYYDMAVQLVTQEQRASISMVQRKLRVGYNRAARMIEMMEREGIVGPSDGRGARQVTAPAPPSM